MLSVLTSVGLFYKYSPKRQRQLEVSLETYNSQLQNTTGAIKKSKLKTMCQTRWIEQHTCNTALCMCLDDITGNSDGKWDGKAVTEAQGLRHSISTPGFISAFKVNLHVFGFTKPLSILLQGSTMDIITVYDEIHVVKKILQELRKDPVKELFRSMLAMAEVSGSEGMSIPRRCGRQTARSNVQASTPEEYWRRTHFWTIYFKSSIIGSIN